MEILNNGTQYHTVNRNYTYTVSFVLMIKGGLFRELASNNGIGALFSRTWLKSSKLLQSAEFYGGAAGVNIASDYLELYMSIPCQYFDNMLPALKEQLTNPSLDSAILTQEKNVMLQELTAEKDNTSVMASHLYNEFTYKDHPYALRLEGTFESVENITIDDIRNYFKNNLNASSAVCCLTGNFTENQSKQIKEILNTIPRGELPQISCINSEIIDFTKKEYQDSRVQQAKLFLGYTAPSATSAEYPTVKLLSEILGGGMSSAYFNKLRKEKGYAYSVDVYYPSRICNSRFTGFIGLNYKNANDAVNTMIELNKNYIANITEYELNKAKNYVRGQFLYGAETNHRQAWHCCFFANLGLGFDHVDTYLSQIQNISIDNLRQILVMFDKPSTVFIYRPQE